MAESENTSKNWNISTSAVLKVVGVFLALYFFFLIRDVILLLLVSMILASALTPLVESLYSRVRFPRALTVGLVYLIFIGLVALILILLVPRLASELVNLGGSIEIFRADFQNESSRLGILFSQFGLAESLRTLGASVAQFTSTLFEKSLGFFGSIFSVISVLVISFYLVAQQNAMKDFVKSLAPKNYHERINNVVQKVQQKLGHWLIGQISLMAVIFILTFIGLTILGVENALVLALFAGLLEIVPYLGPILALIPAVILAFIQSPILGLLVLILYIVIQQVENYLLVPRIIGKSIGANPLVVLIALLIGFRIAGILGMLIAAPLVAVVTVILEDYTGHRKQPE
jgi:predicted PurR-regulated permease PerM